jgi:hypothetical protein
VGRVKGVDMEFLVCICNHYLQRGVGRLDSVVYIFSTKEVS